MNRRFLARSLVLVTALACVPSTASADNPSTAPPASWGWAVVAMALATGGALTTVSLAVHCQPDDLECARWTSLGIWGGIGIASAGGLAGLVMVTAATRQAHPSRLRVSVTVDRSQAGSSMPRATVVYAF